MIDSTPASRLRCAAKIPLERQFKLSNTLASASDVAGPVQTIAIADQDEGRRREMVVMLRELRFEVVLETSDGHELIHYCQNYPPNAAVSGSSLSDICSFEALNQLAELRCCPALAVIDESDLQAAMDKIHDRMMGILVRPFNANQLRPALFVTARRFEQMHQMKHQIEQLRAAVYPAAEAFPQ